MFVAQSKTLDTRKELYEFTKQKKLTMRDIINIKEQWKDGLLKYHILYYEKIDNSVIQKFLDQFK